MGAVVISLDAELSWGYHDKSTVPPRIARAREGWRTAIDLLETYEIPATWAIVGHLFLDACDGEHTEHPLGPEWFSCTPGQHVSGDEWRAPDLVDAIRESTPNHEIASHTFSHALFDDASPVVADAEMDATATAARERGLDLDSHVFPRNKIGNRAQLVENGFQCYRGVHQSWYRQRRLKRLFKLLDWSPVGTAPPLVEPVVDEYGLVNVPPSLYLYSFQGRAQKLAAAVGADPALTVAKRGVDKATDGTGLFHLWLHPHNSLQPGGRERFEQFLAYLDARRAATDLTVRTMGEVARETIADGSR